MTIASINPATGQTVRTFTPLSEPELDARLQCAADTFRAAAIEQLEVWGDRTGTEVIRTKAGGDPSAVLFDALQQQVV